MEDKKCLVCFKVCAPKVKTPPHEEIDNECETVQKQLPAVFLLRKFLDIPIEICCKLLEEHGDPCLWIDCCESHSVLVEKGRRIFDKIEMLQAQYKKLQAEFKAAVISSVDSQKNVPCGSKIGTNGIIRSYISQGNGNGNQEACAPEKQLRKRLENNNEELEQKVGNQTTPSKEQAAPVKKPTGKKMPAKNPANTKTAKNPATKKKPNKKKPDDDIVPFTGQGHKLSDTAGPSSSTSQNGTANVQNSAINQKQNLGVPRPEKIAAAAAALARSEKAKNPDQKKRLAARQRALTKELARKEMEEDKRISEEKLSTSLRGAAADNFDDSDEEYPNQIGSPCSSSDTNSWITSADRFKCPLIGFEVLPKAQMELKIREFLMGQPREDSEVACSIIHSCNKKETVAICVDTLCKYLGNIIDNPKDMKFRKIRCANKLYQDRVACVEGAEDFLSAVGFTKETVANDVSGSKEEVWVFNSEEDEEDFVEDLSLFREELQKTKPQRPILDRNVRVLKPGQVDPRIQPELPPDFFNLTVSELKREQQLRRDVVEQETTLRTKAQREKDLVKSRSGHCRYCLIRIKLPDGFILQGTFFCSERILAVYKFVQENLFMENGGTVNFRLKKYGEGYLDDPDATLLESGLSPSATVIFKGLSLPANLATGQVPYLKSEILESAQTSP